ncbi:MAG: DUF4332 domain-containing protein [Fimbriimonadaceae bacterium]|jgi:hypothetical protein|nr:DUF4332 domain-containing protein [Fimbriimonadaceae bacterium]
MEQYFKIAPVIWLPMAVVAFIAFLIGYILRSIIGRNDQQLELLKREYAARSAGYEKELGELRLRLERAVAYEEASKEWEARYNTAIAGHEGLNMGIHERDLRIEELKRTLTAHSLRQNSSEELEEKLRQMAAQLSQKEEAVQQAKLLLEATGARQAEQDEEIARLKRENEALAESLKRSDAVSADLSNACPDSKPSPVGDQPNDPYEVQKEPPVEIQESFSTLHVTESQEQVPAVTISSAPSAVAVAHHTDLVRLHGLSEVEEGKLVKAGIASQSDLLETCGPGGGRREVAASTEIDPKTILRWVNQVDLQRIPGIDEAMADLLEEVGVDTVLELGTRRPDNLHRKLSEANQTSGKVGAVPSEVIVSQWVEVARNLPRKLSY